MNFRNLRSAALHAYSDAQLIKAFRLSGDKRYMAELFGRHFSTIVHVCSKHTADPYDLVMIVFERALKYLECSQIHNFKSWILKLTVNVCISWERRRKRISAAEGYWFKIEADRIRREERLAFEVIFEEEANSEHLVSQALEKLSEPQRRCIQLFYFEGKPYKEISQFTGMTISEVKSHLQNGKNRLRRILRKK
jgi:RNA polymerase sigma factor (sigma-70 family)